MGRSFLQRRYWLERVIIALRQAEVHRNLGAESRLKAKKQYHSLVTDGMLQTIDLTTPPSTRTDAPVVADACSEERYTTMFATSSLVANRLSSDDGRIVRKKSFSICSKFLPDCLPTCSTNFSTPSDRVGPGNTAFTVTPVPATVSARPRETASCAVLVIP